MELHVVGASRLSLPRSLAGRERVFVAICLRPCGSTPFGCDGVLSEEPLRYSFTSKQASKTVLCPLGGQTTGDYTLPRASVGLILFCPFYFFLLTYYAFMLQTTVRC